MLPSGLRERITQFICITASCTPPLNLHRGANGPGALAFIETEETYQCCSVCERGCLKNHSTTILATGGKSIQVVLLMQFNPSITPFTDQKWGTSLTQYTLPIYMIDIISPVISPLVLARNVEGHGHKMGYCLSHE